MNVVVAFVFLLVSCQAGVSPRQLSGVCMEMCSSDADCPSGQHCLSNGCGHTCQTRTLTLPIPTCPVVTCPTCPTCPPPTTCPVVTCPSTAAPCPTTTTTTSTTSPLPYAITTQGTLWHNVMGGPHLLHCDPPQGSHDPVIWERLEQNFDHMNHTVFNENFHGQLTITKQSMTMSMSLLDVTGVYQCSLATQPSVTARYVLYMEIQGTIDCRQDLAMGIPNPGPGTVFRTTCGPCHIPAATTTNLLWRDLVCASAVYRGLIQPQTGGTVTWLIQNNNEVSLLTEQNGHVVLVP